jgi:hypothetical protein
MPNATNTTKSANNTNNTNMRRQKQITRVALHSHIEA